LRGIPDRLTLTATPFIFPFLIQPFLSFYLVGVRIPDRLFSFTVPASKLADGQLAGMHMIF
jgi:hypothetical protein